jgi:hypothetical protein
LYLPKELNKYGWDWISFLIGLDPFTGYDHNQTKECPWCNIETTELGRHISVECHHWSIPRKNIINNILNEIDENLGKYLCLKDLKKNIFSLSMLVLFSLEIRFFSSLSFFRI